MGTVIMGNAVESFLFSFLDWLSRSEDINGKTLLSAQNCRFLEYNQLKFSKLLFFFVVFEIC